ncbi:hypothetical protein AMECASPLE_022538, partial [Ameca splendens]
CEISSCREDLPWRVWLLQQVSHLLIVLLLVVSHLLKLPVYLTLPSYIAKSSQDRSLSSVFHLCPQLTPACLL